MMECTGFPSKGTLIRCRQFATGEPYEVASAKAFGSGIPFLTKDNLNSFSSKSILDKKMFKTYDYIDVVRSGPFPNNYLKPTKSQVVEFMVKEEGYSYESATTKLMLDGIMKKLEFK